MTQSDKHVHQCETNNHEHDIIYNIKYGKVLKNVDQRLKIKRVGETEE